MLTEQDYWGEVELTAEEIAEETRNSDSEDTHHSEFVRNTVKNHEWLSEDYLDGRDCGYIVSDVEHKFDNLDPSREIPHQFDMGCTMEEFDNMLQQMVFYVFKRDVEKTCYEYLDYDD